MEDSKDAAAHGIERFLADRGSGLLRGAGLLTGDDHAEDLLQTALGKSLGRYDALGNDHKFESYLRTTMYRTFVSWWRRKSWQLPGSRAFNRDDIPLAFDTGAGTTEMLEAMGDSFVAIVNSPADTPD